MKTTIKKLPQSELEIEVLLPAQEFKNYIGKAAEKIKKNLEVKGFRKGKAPEKIVEEKAGKGNIIIEAADLAIKENYPKIIQENGIKAISHPDIDILKVAEGSDFIFKIKLAVLPEIKLPDYKKISSQVKKNKILVEENEVENVLEQIRKSRAKFTSKKEPAQKGDFLEIEYRSPQLPGAGAEKFQKDAFILGEGHFLGNFEEALLGTAAGQEKKVSVAFPGKHFRQDLAGKKIELEIKVRSVQKMELPEINDEFARSLSKNFKDLSFLKKSVEEGISVEKEQKEAERTRAEILNKISQETILEIPDSLVEREKKKMSDDFKSHISRSLNISFEEYLKRAKKTEKEVEELFLPEARQRIKNSLILDRIGEKEGVAVPAQEIAEEVNKMLKNYPDIKKAEKSVDLEKLKLYTENALRNEKTFVFLESFVPKN